MHGKSCTVRHDGRGVFAGLPEEFEVGRYHSLAATASRPNWRSRPLADGEVMAVRHRELPVDGVQFHPESVLTPTGSEIARNFLDGDDAGSHLQACSTARSGARGSARR